MDSQNRDLIQQPELKPIGYVRTPFTTNAPRQPIRNSGENCSLVIYPEYADGLFRLGEFSHIYVLAWLGQAKVPVNYHVIPPWDAKTEVGLFASRSPNRVNPIGLSIVQLLSINDNILTISSIDFFDNTAVLDIKPYIRDLDSHPDANMGWLTDFGSREHLENHIRGIAHNHNE